MTEAFVTKLLLTTLRTLCHQQLAAASSMHRLSQGTARGVAALLRPAGSLISADAARMASTFASAEQHLEWLSSISKLPKGFATGTTTFTFNPEELPEKTAKMTMTIIVSDEPCESFAAMFTKNAFPGAPIIVGRKRVAGSDVKLQACLVNNKISNVCAPGGVEASERLCAEAAKHLGLPSASYILPSSTGVIGWKLPVDSMSAALPSIIPTLQRDSILPAAKGIMTTDLFPKARSRTLKNGGRVVGIAKGAGMIEPNLATMLVFILTDVAVPKEALRRSLKAAVDRSFNALSIDSDTSTSDTVVALSSSKFPLESESQSEFDAALSQVCLELSEDIVRNGEGVQHVIRCLVKGAGSSADSLDIARMVGKSIVNSPLFKCAVAGNDPNVGRLVAAIGKAVGANKATADGKLDVSKTTLKMGGIEIFREGKFALSPETEKKLVAHMKEAQLWESAPAVAAGAKPLAGFGSSAAVHYSAQDVSYSPPIAFPRHDKCVEVSR